MRLQKRPPAHVLQRAQRMGQSEQGRGPTRGWPLLNVAETPCTPSRRRRGWGCYSCGACGAQLSNCRGTGETVPFCTCGSLMAKWKYAFGAHVGLSHASLCLPSYFLHPNMSKMDAVRITLKLSTLPLQHLRRAVKSSGGWGSGRFQVILPPPPPLRTRAMPWGVCHKGEIYPATQTNIGDGTVGGLLGKAVRREPQERFTRNCGTWLSVSGQGLASLR